MSHADAATAVPRPRRGRTTMTLPPAPSAAADPTAATAAEPLHLAFHIDGARHNQPAYVHVTVRAQAQQQRAAPVAAAPQQLPAAAKGTAAAGGGEPSLQQLQPEQRAEEKEEEQQEEQQEEEEDARAAPPAVRPTQSQLAPRQPSHRRSSSLPLPGADAAALMAAQRARLDSDGSCSSEGETADGDGPGCRSGIGEPRQAPHASWSSRSQAQAELEAWARDQGLCPSLAYVSWAGPPESPHHFGRLKSLKWTLDRAREFSTLSACEQRRKEQQLGLPSGRQKELQQCRHLLERLHAPLDSDEAVHGISATMAQPAAAAAVASTSISLSRAMLFFRSFHPSKAFTSMSGTPHPLRPYCTLKSIASKLEESAYESAEAFISELRTFWSACFKHIRNNDEEAGQRERYKALCACHSYCESLIHELLVWMEREERREADELQLLRDEVQKQLEAEAEAERPSGAVIASAQLLANSSQSDLHERLFQSDHEKRALLAIAQRQRLNPAGPSPNSSSAHGGGRKDPRFRAPVHSPQLEHLSCSAQLSASTAAAPDADLIMAPVSLEQTAAVGTGSAPLTSQLQAPESCSDAALEMEDVAWGVTPMRLAQAAASHPQPPQPAQPPPSTSNQASAATHVETSTADIALGAASVPLSPTLPSAHEPPVSALSSQLDLAQPVGAGEQQGQMAPSASLELKGTGPVKKRSRPKRKSRYADDEEWDGEAEQKGVSLSGSGGGGAVPTKKAKKLRAAVKSDGITPAPAHPETPPEQLHLTADARSLHLNGTAEPSQPLPSGPLAQSSPVSFTSPSAAAQAAFSSVKLRKNSSSDRHVEMQLWDLLAVHGRHPEQIAAAIGRPLKDVKKQLKLTLSRSLKQAYAQHCSAFAWHSMANNWKTARLPLPPKFTESGDSYTIAQNKAQTLMHMQAISAGPVGGQCAAAAVCSSDLIPEPSTDDELAPTAPTTPAHSASVATTPPLPVASYPASAMHLMPAGAGARPSACSLGLPDRSAFPVEMQQQMLSAGAYSQPAFGVATVSAVDGLGSDAITALPARPVIADLQPPSSPLRYSLSRPYDFVLGSGPIRPAQLEQLQKESTHESGPAPAPAQMDPATFSAHSQMTLNHFMASYRDHSWPITISHLKPMGGTAAVAAAPAAVPFHGTGASMWQADADAAGDSALAAAPPCPPPLAAPASSAVPPPAVSSHSSQCGAVNSVPLGQTAGSGSFSCAGGDGCAAAPAGADRRRAPRAAPVASRASARLRGQPAPAAAQLPQPHTSEPDDATQRSEVEIEIEHQQ